MFSILAVVIELVLQLTSCNFQLYVYRYIHEVLQMNDGGESSDSGAATDSSWDDPEHKNLFDRL